MICLCVVGVIQLSSEGRCGAVQVHLGVGALMISYLCAHWDAIGLQEMLDGEVLVPDI